MIGPSVGITQHVECPLELTGKVRGLRKKGIFILPLKITFMQHKAKVHL